MNHVLTIQPQSPVPLRVAQQNFNQSLGRVSELSEAIERLQHWEVKHRQAHLQAVFMLQQQTDAARKRLLLLLHQRVQSADLTRAQQRMTRQQILRCMASFESTDDPEIQALAQLYPRDSEEQSAAQEALQASQRLWDEHLQLWRQHQNQQARKAAKRSARKALERPQTHLHAEQLKVDAQTTLQRVYRHLASALHPDREMDEAMRQMKTQLMGQVNAAYERKELTTLLHLQSQTQPCETSRSVAMDDLTLNAMSLLLQEQAQAKARELSELAGRLTQELGVEIDAKSSEHDLSQALQALQSLQRDVLYRVSFDVGRVEQDDEFKRWLKEKSVLDKQLARDT
jgi:hypothetical protein